MPKMVNSFLRIDYGERKARDLLSERFSQRGWGTPYVRELRLLFLPEYFFEYCIALEGGEKKGVVSDFSVSKGCFDPVSKTLFQPSFTEADFSNEFNERAEFKVIDSGLRKTEAKKIVSFLLSKEKSVPRDSIEFINFSRYFVPVWNFVVDCDNSRFELEVNAFKGSVLEKKPIPPKKKPWSSATRETIKDLKKPKNWLSYLGEMVGGLVALAKSVYSNRLLGKFFSLLKSNKNFQLAVLFAILFALLFLAFA